MRQIRDFWLTMRFAGARRLRKLWFVLLVLAVLALPSPARAQFEFRNFGGGYWGGGFGPFGWGAFGPFGGGGFGSSGYGYPGFFARGAGFGSPFGGAPIMSSSFTAGAPYASPYPYDAYRPEPYLMPGFAASEPVRLRLTMYPAIVEPAREVIAAVLDGADQDRARISLRVPSATAKVYLDGVLMKEMGLHRLFITPKLNAGSSYVLNVEVRWQTAEGRSRTVQRQISLRNGASATLDLSNAD